MNNKNTFNWYENPDEVLVKINKKSVNFIIKKINSKFNSIRDFVNYSKINHKFIYQIKDDKPLRVKTLKNILKALNINFNLFNNEIKEIGGSKFTFKIKFPIKLNKKEIAILVAAFMSDGNNQVEHPFYSNTGFLGDKIIKTVKKFIPNISYEIRDEKIRFHSILGRILNKIGVPFGNKTIINPKIPKFIKLNRKLSKVYLIQAFDDEGHPATEISRKIVLGRSVAVKSLPNLFVENMPWKEKMYFNNLPDYIKKIVIKNPPRLLVDEHKLLKRLKINSSMRCRGLTKYEETNSADWVIEISGKENIRSFNNFIGFSQPEKIERMNQYLN